MGFVRFAGMTLRRGAVAGMGFIRFAGMTLRRRGVAGWVSSLRRMTLWSEERGDGFFALLRMTRRGKQRHAGFVAESYFFVVGVLRDAAAWMSFLKAASLRVSPSWMSMARRTLPSRLELKSLVGSARAAPLAKVSLTTAL
jgi:hypothetical protein